MLEESNVQSSEESNSDLEINNEETSIEMNSKSKSMVSSDQQSLPALLEAIILAAGRPISEDDILKLFTEDEKPNKKELRQALKALQDSCESRGVSLIEMASGYQFQVKLEWAPIIARLWEEKAPKYSRAFFETLALIAYRQPVTRGEIEEIRGVSLSLSIFKTLLEEREWIRVVGHRDVPGRPALYATTKNFLDYFGLKSLEELPSLPEIMNLDAVEFPEISFEGQALHVPSTLMDGDQSTQTQAEHHPEESEGSQDPQTLNSSTTSLSEGAQEHEAIELQDQETSLCHEAIELQDQETSLCEE